MNGLRRFTRMIFRTLGGWPSTWGARIYDSLSGLRSPADAEYERRVGDGSGSSTVMAPILWIARTFPEAPPTLWKVPDEGPEIAVRDHPLLRLLVRPNEHYTGPILWMATMTDYTIDGNAYWLILRDGTGLPAEIWWVPHWMISPRRKNPTDYVSFYEYNPSGEPISVDPADVIHFRFGLDASDDAKGYSPLKSVLREVFTDDEAARFTAALLRNMGVPGLIVSPDDASFTPSEADVAATKNYLSNAFNGDKRGEPLVMSGPTKVEQFGFSPEQLMLRELRRIPEERVTAVLGVPAIVAGLGAGLDRSTFTNMGEAREAAYESGIIPTQRIIAEDIRWKLLPEWESDVFPWRFGFDLQKVRVLQDDEDKLVRRYDVGIRGGWIRVSEGRRSANLPVDDTDEVYIRQSNTVAVPVDPEAEIIAMAPPPSENGNGNGNGTGDVAAEVVRQMTNREEPA